MLLETFPQMPSFPVWSPVSIFVLLLGRSEVILGMETVSCVRSKPALCTAESPPSPCLVPTECWDVCDIAESGLVTQVPDAVPG